MSFLKSNTDGVNDFNSLMRLAKEDPTKFSELREKIVQDFIHSCETNKQDRLIRLQWRIDEARKQATNPLDSVIKISGMMWQSLDELVIAQTQLSDSLKGEDVIERPKAKVVQFADYKKVDKSD